MMRVGIIIVAVLLAGCRQVSGSMPKESSLAVTVVAEPKEGAKPFRRFVPVYDRMLVESSLPIGDYELVNYSRLEDIVVWIEPLDADFVASADPVIRLMVEHPPVQAAPAKQRVFLRNATDQPLSVYSVSEGNVFDLAPLVPGATVEHQFSSPGLVELIDLDSDRIVARVLVLQPSATARTVTSGQEIRFDHLPPGRWRVAAWHERLPGAEVDVSLRPGRIRRIELPIGVDVLPQADGRDPRSKP